MRVCKYLLSSLLIMHYLFTTIYKSWNTSGGKYFFPPYLTDWTLSRGFAMLGLLLSNGESHFFSPQFSLQILLFLLHLCVSFVFGLFRLFWVAFACGRVCIRGIFSSFFTIIPPKTDATSFVSQSNADRLLRRFYLGIHECVWAKKPSWFIYFYLICLTNIPHLGTTSLHICQALSNLTLFFLFIWSLLTSVLTSMLLLMRE